ncbi:MAG: ABC transporter substrate-binding protein [Acetobacteraceae bacterium]
MPRFGGALLAACFLLGIGAAKAATHGGTFIFGASADVIFLDPVFEQQNPDIWFAMNVYDTLLQPSNDGKSVGPGLASEYNMSPDGMTLTLTLRPGVKFADGSLLTPEDVLFSLRRAQNKDYSSFTALIESIGAIEIAGPDKVILHLKHPDPAIFQALATFNTGILPEKLLNAAPGNTPREKARAFAEKPLGTGPFMVTKWTPGTELDMVRNPYYWQHDAAGQPLPYLDRIRIVIIPDDATRILKLKAGEIGAAEFVPYSRIAEIRADPNLKMILSPAAQIFFIAMNNRPTLWDGTPNPLSDKRVRQALNYAVNKKAIVQVMTYGAGKPQVSPISTPTPLAEQTTQVPYPYDPAKAKDLLKEAGFPNGFDVGIYTVAGNSDQAAEAAAIQQMWKQIGVRLKIQQMDSATRIAKFHANQYQMRTALWTADINDPSEAIEFLTYGPMVHSNYSGFDDPELDAAFIKSQAEMDVEKRRALVKRIQDIYVENAPMVFLVEAPYPVAVNKKVDGFVQSPLGNDFFAGVHLEK